jgi:spermidine synthase
MTRRPNQLLLVLFFLSGASSLIYEIVWTRLFTIVIGNTVFSVSAILSVFMTGLAVGSWLAGRFVDQRLTSLARVYALLEAGIGVSNLLIPILLKTATPVFGSLYSVAYQSGVLMAFGRFAITFLLLIIPATLIGATLPVLVRFYFDNIENVGTQVGRLYAVNTLGAAVGAATAGFVLVPHGGTTLALYVAVVLNFAIAVAAWFSGLKNEITRTSLAKAKPTQGPRVVVVAMFFSGFAALLDEVAWTRVLALIGGPTTYAFTFMLCSMIAGLGFGAWIGSRLSRRFVTELSTFAWIQAGVAWTSLALIPAFGRMPLGIASLVRRYSGSIATLLTFESLMLFALMLAPTIFFGMTFPVASKLYARSDASVGTEVSSLYAANTAGGIIGSLVAGFVLIPAAGSQKTLVLAVLLTTAVGVLTAALHRRWIPAVTCLVAVPVVFMIPQWNLELMSSGAYKYAPSYAPNADLETLLGSGDLLYFKEGAVTTVSVRKHPGRLTLSVDGKVDATDAGDMTTQKMLAHLPLLLSNEPKNVAIIGLGSGVTAGSALQHSIEKLDVIEISPEVVTASGFFSHVNHRALEDPRTKLIVGDGRNHLRYTQQHYDVIISEPSNPWMSGMASLFTREFFAESLLRLTENGIHCQWFHSYNMSSGDLRTVIRTFRAVFPHAMLWTLNEYDFLLIGSRSPVAIDRGAFDRNFDRVRRDLAEIKILDPYTVLSALTVREKGLDQLAQAAALNTDNMPVLEFRAPLSLYASTTAENLAAISAVASTAGASAATSVQHRHKGEALLAAEAFSAALKEFRAAVDLDGTDRQAWNGIVETVRGLDREELDRFFGTALSVHPSNIVRLAAADFYSQQGAFQKSAELLDAVLTTEPDNVEALERLADALAELGKERVAETADRLLKVVPDNAIGLYHLATAYLYQSRFDEAIQVAKRSLEKDPKSSRARNVLAIAYERTFQLNLAEAEFRRATIESSDDWVSFNNYGIFLFGRSRFAEALQQFRRSLRLNPENVQGFLGISEVLHQTGNKREADKWRQKAQRLSALSR